MIFQLRVSLRSIKPEIWRRFQLPEDTRLPHLHKTLQTLFGWENYHLHEFTTGRQRYGVVDEDSVFDDRELIDERSIPLSRLVTRPGDTFEYLYDFGDDWIHDVLLEATLLPDPALFYPRCLDGARSGPPEDVGGPNGYSDYLEAISDPSHEEHENMLRWSGPFDPEIFSTARVNAALEKMFTPRSPRGPAAAKSRQPKPAL